MRGLHAHGLTLSCSTPPPKHTFIIHLEGRRRFPRKGTPAADPSSTGTFPGAHSVPSSGGPFLVLQKYGLSGWLHHSCLQGSKVRNWKRAPVAGQGTSLALLLWNQA